MLSKLDEKIKHYLFIDKEKLRSLLDLLATKLDSIDLTAYTIDGTEIKFDYSEELLNYDNYQSKRIKRLKIAAVSTTFNSIKRIEIALGEFAEGSNGHVLSIHDGSAECLGFDTLVKNAVAKMKPQYDFLRFLPILWFAIFWPALPFSFAMLWDGITALHQGTVFSQSAATGGTNGKFFTALATIWFFGMLLGAVVTRVQAYIFPRFFLLLNESHTQHTRIVAVRKIVIGIIGSLLMALFIYKIGLN